MPAQGRNNIVIPYREGFCRSGLPSYELLCSNVISDERGEPRVMSCPAATLMVGLFPYCHFERSER